MSGDKTAPIRVYVYDLETPRCAAAVKWLEQLAAAPVEVCLEPGDKAPSLPWCGFPSIVVGGRAAVIDYLRGLSDSAQRLLADNAYFWILSEFSEPLLKADARLVPWFDPQRPVILDWGAQNQNLAWERLALLAAYPNLKGLSQKTHHVRREIQRLARGSKCASTPVLILGESGTGKEEVARALHAAWLSWRREQRPQGDLDAKQSGYAAVPCGWFNLPLLQSQLFGHRKGAFTDAVHDVDGLLVKHRSGAILLDDFDAAPLELQAALLRVLATPRGQSARFQRLGDVEPRDETDAWLMFATNKSVEVLLEGGRMREDFLFRFEERVINVPPLRDRPADLPAIALHLWEAIWDERRELESQQRELKPRMLEFLVEHESRWSGNVRALRTLLTLTAAMMGFSANNSRSFCDLLGSILDRGSEYKHWVGITAEPTYWGENRVVDPVVRKILAADCNAPRGVPTDDGQDTLAWTASERWCSDELRLFSVPEFQAALAELEKKRRDSQHVPVRVRLCRIVWYVMQAPYLDAETARELLQVSSQATATKALKALLGEQILSVSRSTKNKKDVYSAGATLRRLKPAPENPSGSSNTDLAEPSFIDPLSSAQ